MLKTIVIAAILTTNANAVVGDASWMEEYCRSRAMEYIQEIEIIDIGTRKTIEPNDMAIAYYDYKEYLKDEEADRYKELIAVIKGEHKSYKEQQKSHPSCFLLAYSKIKEETKDNPIVSTACNSPSYEPEIRLFVQKHNSWKDELIFSRSFRNTINDDNKELIAAILGKHEAYAGKQEREVLCAVLEYRKLRNKKVH